jgi:hypothetical protein
MEGVQQEFSPELLALYYGIFIDSFPSHFQDRLFPFEEMFEWLSARSPRKLEFGSVSYALRWIRIRIFLSKRIFLHT